MEGEEGQKSEKEGYSIPVDVDEDDYAEAPERNSVAKRFLRFLFMETIDEEYMYPEFVLLNYFLRVGFFTLTIPFLLRRKLDGYELYSSCKCLNVLIWGFAIARFLWFLLNIAYWYITIFFQEDFKVGKDFFKYFSRFFVEIGTVLWFYTFWVSGSKFRKLFRITRTTEANGKFPNLNRKTLRKKISFQSRSKLPTFCIALAASTISTGMLLLIGIAILYNDYNEFGQKWIYHKNEDIIEKLIIIFGKAKFKNGTYIPENWSSWTFAKYKTEFEDEKMSYSFALLVLRFIYCLTQFADGFTMYQIPTFVFIGSLMFYIASERLVSRVCLIVDAPHSTGNDLERVAKQVERVSEEFGYLKRLLDTINTIWGDFVTINFFSAGCYLAGIELYLLETGKKDVDILVLYFHFLAIPTILLAAEASSKISSLQKLLRGLSIRLGKAITSEMGESREEVLSAYFRLTIINQRETFGLKGYKFFVVTYDFVGTMTGLFATYSIVALQFAQTETEKCKQIM